MTKNYTTPRTLSEATYSTGYPSIRRSRSPSRGWFTWSGWIAFLALLLAVSGSK